MKPTSSNKILEDAGSQLMHLLANNCGPKAMVDLGSRLLGNPIAVGDTGLRVMYTSEGMPESVPMAKPGLIPSHFSSDDEFIRFNEEAYYSEMPIITAPQYGGYQIVLTRLKVHGQIAGYMSVLLYNHPLLDNDMDIILLLRNVIEAELGKNSSLLSQPPRPGEYTLTALLSGYSGSLRNNADANIHLGINKNALLYVIVFRSCGHLKAAVPELAVRRELSRMCDSKISVLFDGNIVILRQGMLCMQPELTKPYDTMNAFLKKHDLICGISTQFSQITDIRKYYLQAVSAIEMGNTISPYNIYRYEEIAVRHLFETQLDKNGIHKYCHPAAYALLQYDQENETHFSNVIKVYVENEKNAMLTATMCHLSKASIYRILDRIKSITGQSLDDPAHLFNLYFSLKLLELNIL